LLKLFPNVAILGLLTSTRLSAQQLRRQTNKMAVKEGRGNKYTCASNSSTVQKINPECNPSYNTQITFTKQKKLLQPTNSLLVRIQKMLELTFNMMFR
jgi:hypothetical protein